MGTQRATRVGEQIHKEISELLIKGLKDPRIGFVTITGVEVTSDLHLARVYFTVMGDEKAVRETEKGLTSSVPYIRRELGQRLRLRHVPDIVFKYDASLEYGNRIEAIIQDLHNEKKDDDRSDTEEN